MKRIITIAAMLLFGNCWAAITYNAGTNLITLDDGAGAGDS